MNDDQQQLRIVVMNPNTSSTVTKMIDERAHEIARPDTRIATLCPDDGPEAVAHWRDAYRSAVGMLDRLDLHTEPIDALVLAGFGDVGLDALRESVDAPVIDITEAGVAASLTLGRRYGIVTTLATMVDPIRTSLSGSGLLQQCAGIEALELGVVAASTDRDEVLPRLISAAQKLMQRADVICLGSAVFSPYVHAVRAAVDVPVVDPLAAAITIAEATCLAHQLT